MNLFGNWLCQVVEKFFFNMRIYVSNSHRICLLLSFGLRFISFCLFHNLLKFILRLLLFLLFFFNFLLVDFSICLGFLFLRRNIFLHISLNGILVKMHIEIIILLNKTHLILTFVKKGKICSNKIVYSLELINSL